MNEENNNIEEQSSLEKYNNFLDKAYNSKEDIDAINKRGTNKGEHSASFSRRNNEDLEEETDTPKSKKNNKDSKLGEKDSLEDENTSKDDKKDKSKSDDKEKDKGKGLDLGNSNESLKDKILDKTIVGKVKKLLLKVKITVLIAAIAGGLLLLIAIFLSLFMIFDRIIDSISTFFGISEHETSENMSVEESDSLLLQEDYLKDPDTGEYYTVDTLVETLAADNDCSKITGLTKIIDFFDSWDGKFNSVCSYIRYIESAESDYEKKYDGLKLDRALIISSIFYGYALQPSYNQMDNPASSEIIPASQYLKSLEDVLSSGKITRDDLDLIIENSFMNAIHDVYTWEIVDEKNLLGEVTKSVGYCKKATIEDVYYDIKKWNVFMRYGKTNAEIYQKETIKKKTYEESSIECTGEISDDELLAMVAASGHPASLDGSVKTAQDVLSKITYGDLTLFEQAAKREGSQKDSFTSYETADVTVNFNYTDGFIYTDFPYFEESMSDSSINIEYDDAITPKVIEDTRSYIVEKKPDMNAVLHLEDMDEGYTYLDGADTETSVVLGAYCNDLLTAPIDQIKVKVQDCNGRTLRTTTFKEYITGVAYREVSDREDDYVKAQMVAAISYALHRRQNSTKGTVITMKSGNCDQAYCPMSMGCHSEKANIKCTSTSYCTSYIPGPGSGTNTGVASSSLIAKYNSYYEEVKNFLVVLDNQIYTTPYTSTRQKEWYENAAKGMSYTQIIQLSYPGTTLVRCTDSASTASTTDDTLNTTQYGNGIVENKYTEIAQDLGKYYGFSYNKEKNTTNININPNWKTHNLVTINSNCKSANWSVDYTVNTQAKDNFKKAFTNMCNILTNGVKISDGTKCTYTINDFSGGQTFTEKETVSGIVSDLSYGIAQDWNYNKKYTINGKIYTPYDSTRSLENYLEFVNALGKEEDCRNINYILYKYAYEPAGFVWGGNNGRNGNSGKYNGMHYRIDY